MRSPLAQYFIRGIGLPLIHQTCIDQRQSMIPFSALLFAGMPTPSNSWKVNHLLGRGRCALAKRLDFPASRQD